METKKKDKKKIIIIVVAVILVLLACALLFAGNFLFEFALYPGASFTMNDLFQRGNVEGIGDGPVVELSPERQEWRDYAVGAYEWFQTEGEAVELQRPDGVRRGKWFQQEGHRYGIFCHGYYSSSVSEAPYAKKFYDMGWSVLIPDALAHGESDGTFIGMGWLERPDVLGWIGTIIQKDPEAEIILHGVSMGGATVMMVSGEDLPDNVKCIVEDCGYSSVWDEFSLQLKNLFHLPTFPILNVTSMFSKLRAGYSFEEASAVDQLKKATVPMLFIHGDADTFVPFEMLDVVYDACASAEKEKLVVPGAAHGEAASTEPTLYWDTVTVFVGRYVD